MQICSKSEWGSSSTVLMFMLYWREQIDRKLHVFATKHEANTYSEHLIHYHDDVNTAVKRNAHVRDLRKRGKNKGKLYTKECGLNKNTKYKKTPENIR